MNPGLKQRLIGGAVLVGLAVIFLPMLLPGKGDSTMPVFGSNVPDKPDTPFTPIEIPLELPPAAPAGQVSVVDQPQPGEVVTKEKPQLVEPPATAAMPPASSATAASAQPAAPKPPAAAPVAAVTPPAKSTAPVAAPAVPTSTRTPAPAEAWAIQLGSFSNSANAIALQDKARKAGFRAYVEKVKSGATTSYRVRIGPESSRERADTTKGKVEAKLKMKAMVVPHKS